MKRSRLRPSRSRTRSNAEERPLRSLTPRVPCGRRQSEDSGTNVKQRKEELEIVSQLVLFARTGRSLLYGAGEAIMAVSCPRWHSSDRPGADFQRALARLLCTRQASEWITLDSAQSRIWRHVGFTALDPVFTWPLKPTSCSHGVNARRLTASKLCAT